MIATITSYHALGLYEFDQLKILFSPITGPPKIILELANGLIVMLIKP